MCVWWHNFRILRRHWQGPESDRTGPVWLPPFPRMQQPHKKTKTCFSISWKWVLSPNHMLTETTRLLLLWKFHLNDPTNVSFHSTLSSLERFFRTIICWYFQLYLFKCDTVALFLGLGFEIKCWTNGGFPFMQLEDKRVSITQKTSNRFSGGLVNFQASANNQIV